VSALDRLVLLCGAALAITAAMSCSSKRSGADSEERSTRPASAPRQRAPSLAGPHALNARAAFDLIATSQGALLVRAAPDGVRALALDPDGAPHGREWRLPTTSAIAVAAAAGGGRAAIAWVTHTANGASPATASWATFGPDTAEGFAPPREIRAMDLPAWQAAPAARARGLVSLSAAHDGTLVLTVRWTDSDCSAQPGHCVRYARQVIGAPPSGSRRGIEAMEVSTPCAELLFGGVWVSGTWYDGTCTDDGRPTSNVWVLRPAIEYAAVTPVLAGCTPRGVAPVSDGAVVIAECDDGIAAASLDLDGQVRRDVRRARRLLSCEGGRMQARIDATGAGGTLGLTLDAPASRLEAMLPDDVAPAGSRAAWTGEALLIAMPRGHVVVLARRRCVSGRIDAR